MLRNCGVINFKINRIGFQIKYCPKSLFKYITDLITRYNFIHPASSLRPKVKLSIYIISNLSFRLLKKAKLVARFRTRDSNIYRCYRKGYYLFLTEGKNLLIIRPERGEGTLIIKKQEKLNLPPLLDRFILTAIGQLLHRLGLFFLHASGVVKNGHKILFVSKSGGGKSTSALSLFLGDWKYISDDFVFLRRKNRHQVVASSLSSELRLKGGNPILFKNTFHSFEKSSNRSEDQENIYRVNIASLAPNRIVESFIPNLIFFPYISKNRFSVIKPISKLGTLFLLINQSKSVFLAREAVKKI